MNRVDKKAGFYDQYVKKLTGKEALFPYQKLVINNTLEAAYAHLPVEFCPEDQPQDADTVSGQIVILPTGAGKSLCFLFPALLLEGVTLIIYPLLSLIRDQQKKLQEMGHEPIPLIGGQSYEQREQIFSSLQKNKRGIILANPETILSRGVLEKLQQVKIVSLVIDEAHTVSQWGRSFRPQYLRVREIIDALKPVTISAFTATGSEAVVTEIKTLVFNNEACRVVRSSIARPNIHYSVVRTFAKYKQLLHILREQPGPVLIFTRSRQAARLLAARLRESLSRADIYYYHARLDRAEKKQVEDWFWQSEAGILCATCAYGMGVDKPNIRTIIHYDLCLTPEAYIQETGRAGRDQLPSRVFLLVSARDQAFAEKLKAVSSWPRVDFMYEYAFHAQACRSRWLISALSPEEIACNGCDVCDQRVFDAEVSVQTVLGLIGKNRRRFTLAQMSEFLAGRSHNPLYSRYAGYGILAALTDEEIIEVLENFLLAAKIRVRSRGMWKGLVESA